MAASGHDDSDAMFAASLARLWPHRLHESSWLKNVPCHLGLHRWAELNLGILDGREVKFCRWCSKIKVDGVVYDG